MQIYVEAIGVRGPGLEGWAASRPILAGMAPYVPAPLVLPPNDLLPANERRRAPQTAKIALALGAEIFAGGPVPEGIVSVFTASGGDGETVHDMLATLASPVRELSPTRFHNSVHNAAAGYWSIATGHAATTSLSAYDGSFSAGLLEAAAHIAAGQAVLLIAYDVPYPPPLHDVRPIGAIFGIALLLSPEPTRATTAKLAVTLREGRAGETPLPAGLDALRRTVPAARGLPLLAALARGEAACVDVDYLPGLTLAVEVSTP
jgi:hypothetical protein